MIKLESLALKNFCQHRYFHAKLGTGVVGLTGDLGSGKSNALYAIRATLTDDFRALGTKESCINWSCSKKSPSYIEADWDLHGTKVRIKRSLRPAESTLTYLDTNLTIHGKSNVAEVLRKLVGIDERVLANYVFVEQWKTFGFISQQEAERAKLFAHLCGTEDLAVLHKVLSEFVSEDAKLVPEIDEAEEKRLRLENHRLTKLSAELFQKIKKTRFSMSKWNLDKIRKAHSAIVSAGSFSLMLGPLQERYDNALARLKELSAKLERFARFTKDGFGKLAAAYDRLGQRIKLADGIPAQPHNPVMPVAGRVTHELVVEAHQVVNQFMVLKSEAERAYAQAKMGVSVCPTCGTKLNYKKKTISERWKKLVSARELLSEATQSLDTAQQSFRAWQTYDEALATYKRDMAARTAFIKKHNLRVLPSPEDIKLAFNRMKAYEAQISKKAKLKGLQKEKMKLASSLMQDIRETSMLIEDLQEEIKELNVGKDEAEIKNNLEEALRLEERLKGIETVRAQTCSNLEEIKRQQAHLRQVREKAGKAVRWLEDADYIRDVMHHSALPRDIAVSRLNALTGPINKTLGQFGMDFVVKPDETLSFLVKTGSGAETTAARLSGGQKMLLAISFWLAINSVFVSDVGFLTLDEPTAGLNRESIQSLSEVIGVFSKSAKKAGRQVIVVTHENALRKVFDQCIELPPV